VPVSPHFAPPPPIGGGIASFLPTFPWAVAQVRWTILGFFYGQTLPCPGNNALDVPRHMRRHLYLRRISLVQSRLIGKPSFSSFLLGPKFFFSRRNRPYVERPAARNDFGSAVFSPSACPHDTLTVAVTPQKREALNSSTPQRLSVLVPPAHVSVRSATSLFKRNTFFVFGPVLLFFGPGHPLIGSFYEDPLK